MTCDRVSCVTPASPWLLRTFQLAFSFLWRLRKPSVSLYTWGPWIHPQVSCRSTTHRVLGLVEHDDVGLAPAQAAQAGEAAGLRARPLQTHRAHRGHRSLHRGTGSPRFTGGIVFVSANPAADEGQAHNGFNAACRLSPLYIQWSVCPQSGSVLRPQSSVR